MKMERNLRSRNINSVNGIDFHVEGDVALGRGMDVVSQVVIQRNLRRTNTIQTATNQEISSFGNQDDLPQFGPSEHPSDRSTDIENETRANRRHKWTKEEYIGIIEAYYLAVETKHPNGMMAGTYAIWRERYPNIHQEMNVVKLNNQRNYIMKSSKLTTYELESIRRRICDEIRINTCTVEGEIANELNPNNEISEQHPIHTSIQERHTQNMLQPNNEEIEFEARLREKIAEVNCIPISERKPINKIRQCRNTGKQIKIANEVIKKMIEGKHQDLTELNHLLYATAAIIAGEKKEFVTSRTANNNEPIWSRRINQQIEKYRKQVSILDEYKKNNGVVSTKVVKKLRK